MFRLDVQSRGIGRHSSVFKIEATIFFPPGNVGKYLSGYTVLPSRQLPVYLNVKELTE
jgi:hypothetical protein